MTGDAGPQGLTAVARWFDRRCHLVYLLVALPLVIWFAWWMPAFQNPDEPAHFSRAVQISGGVLVGTRFGISNSGGWIDAAVPRAQAPYSQLPFNPAAKVTRDQVEMSRAIGWSGELELSGFRNTVNYGPLFYLPQAAGAWIGRRVGLGVVDTLVAARVANGLACCALGFLALRLCAFGKRVMFSVLCWPMTLSLSGSSSHDGLLIASAAVMIAIASRVSSEDRSATPIELAIFLIALVGGITGRPPHAGFAMLLPPLIRRWRAGGDAMSRRRMLALAAAAVICVGWIVVVRTYTLSITLLDVPDAPADAPSIDRQLAFLASNPGVIPSLIYRSIVLGWKPLITTAVGVLGWLDTLMPSWYYWMAAAAFALAVIADRRIVSVGSRRAGIAGWAAFIVFVAATYVSIYLTWMGVGAADVLGVQGRYLLAGVPLMAWLLPARRAQGGALMNGLGAAAWIAVALFVVVTYAIVPSHVVTRYYAP